MVNLSDILKIALQHDFAPLNSVDNRTQLLPTEVLKKLTESLEADGGNLSIWTPHTNGLAVRGWYKRGLSSTHFASFRDKMRLIGNNIEMRRRSSTYRCFDSGRPIIIAKSDCELVANSTLDLATLELKNACSALAVPLFFHSRPMGVLHMDVDEYERKCFTEEDSRALTSVAELLPSIIYNTLMIEGITAIKSHIASYAKRSKLSTLNEICENLSQLLLIPDILIYQRHASIADIFEIQGATNSPVAKQLATDFPRIDCRVSEGNIIEVITQAQPKSSCQVGSLQSLLGSDDPRLNVKYKYAPIKDARGDVDGFLLCLVGPHAEFTEPFSRLVSFFADFTTLSLNALEQVGERTRRNHERVNHEFVRHINQIHNTGARLRAATGQATRLLSSKGSITAKEQEFLQTLTTVSSTLKSQVELAAETVRTTIEIEEDDRRLNSADPFSSNATLGAARRRHFEYLNAQSSIPIEFRRSIEDLLNAYTKRMDEKRVRWRRDLDSCPNQLPVQQNNFELIFGNLIDNAVKYSKNSSRIVVSTFWSDYEVAIRIANEGPHIQIAGTEASDIFVNEYRGPSAKTLASGDGIGLWEARLVSRLWGGEPLRLVSSLPTTEEFGVRWALVTFELRVPFDPLDQMLLTPLNGRRKGKW